MALSSKNALKLAKKIATEFGISRTKARAAIDRAWMCLACSDVQSWRSVTLSRYGDNYISVIDGDRMVGTLMFDDGVLPPSETQQAWAEYEAYIAANPVQPINRSERLIARIVSASLNPEAPSCVDLTIEPEDDSGVRTMVMLPLITEGEELLAYAAEQVGKRAKVIFTSQAFCMDQIPFGISVETPVVDLIMPIDEPIQIAA